MFCRDDSKASDEGVHDQEDDIVQQLNRELSPKGMIFSKNCIQLTKVVGQGRLHSTSKIYINILLCRRVRIGVLWLP